MSYGFKTIVTGDYACFSRPEMKVERVSYDVPTPSALEGLIKSVYWKPADKQNSGVQPYRVYQYPTKRGQR
mgnify:CR=1 FL=1